LLSPVQISVSWITCSVGQKYSSQDTPVEREELYFSPLTIELLTLLLHNLILEDTRHTNSCTVYTVDQESTRRCQAHAHLYWWFCR